MAVVILRHCPAIWKLAPALAGLFLFPLAVRADCLDAAASWHHLDPALVRAVATVESGLDPAAYHLNANGSEDIGLMAVHSVWLPALARAGIDRSALTDACVKVFVCTWILAQNLSRLGLTWNAVGAYNASSPQGRLRYADRVYIQLVRSVSGAVSPARVPSALNQQTASRRPANSFAQPAAFSIPATSAVDESLTAHSMREAQP